MTHTTTSPLTALVRDSVRAGDTVYIGNFGAQLFAVGHELIRLGLTDLHVVVGSGGLLLDQLIGAGVARTVTFAHCWNPVGPAPAWNLRRASEGGGSGLEIQELSLGMLGAAFQAAAWGVPFMPVAISDHTGYVTDGWARGALSRVSSEYGDSWVVRALRPDVAFIHADMADSRGNALLTEPFGEHLFAAQAATRTVVVAEEVLPAGQRLPQPAALAGVHVDAVTALPGAVAPDGTPGRYPRDVDAYTRYAAESATAESFSVWLEQHRAVAP
jgi:glutaconate CoA-transferase subunit A